MILYGGPVRENVPELVRYTFLDENGAIIDLTSYVSVALYIKVQGTLYASIVADFLSPTTAGVVQATGVTFTSAGAWAAQFVCTDASGGKLYGEPIGITVVPNVDNLGINQPMRV